MRLQLRYLYVVEILDRHGEAWWTTGDFYVTRHAAREAVYRHRHDPWAPITRTARIVKFVREQ